MKSSTWQKKFAKNTKWDYNLTLGFSLDTETVQQVFI